MERPPPVREMPTSQRQSSPIARKARSINPEHPSTRAFLASTYALMGEAGRADTELAEARRLSTDNRYSSITRLRAAAYWGVPKIQALYEATYFAGLRKAGVPEE